MSVLYWIYITECNIFIETADVYLITDVCRCVGCLIFVYLIGDVCTSYLIIVLITGDVLRLKYVAFYVCVCTQVQLE